MVTTLHVFRLWIQEMEGTLGANHTGHTDMNNISSGPPGWGLGTQLCVTAKTNYDINTVTAAETWCLTLIVLMWRIG